MNILDQGLTSETSQNLYLGSELEMLWHCQSDPRFSYYAIVPGDIVKNDQIRYEIMCFVHGTGRTTEDYHRLFRSFAEKHHLILLFPLFPGGLLEKDDFNSYKLLTDHGIRYDLILLQMMEEIAERYPGQVNTEKLWLYGWSGGGQFVHRFLYVHPEKLHAVCIGAPGRITYLDDTRDYYWGTRDFHAYFDKDYDLDRIREVPVLLMIGEYDTKFVGESDFGSNRMERLLNLKKNYESCNIPVQMEILEGFEHKGHADEKAEAVMRFFEKIMKQQGGRAHD